MKKIVLSIIILAQTIFFSEIVTAQSLTSAEERQIMLAVVNLFESYERYSSIDVDHSDKTYSFRALFVNDDAPVYNDLLGLSDEKSLSVKDYATLMSKQSSISRIIIRNIDKERIYNESGIWKIDCSFDKNVNLSNNCDIEFASDFFNESDYHLHATIAYDNNSKVCKIEKITGEATPIRFLEKDYRVLKATSAIDNNSIIYNGKPLEFNAMGQAFISSAGSFVCKDPEVSIKVQEEDPQCHLWSITLKPKPWKVKAHYDLGLGEGYALDNSDLFSNTKTAHNTIGIDLGYTIPSKSILKVGLFTGVGFSQSKIDLSYENPDYFYTTNADVDGDTYVRHYQDLSLTQSIKMTDITIPVYVNFNCSFNKIVNLFVDLGFKLNMNISHEVDATNGSAYIYGIYPQYDNLRMDEHWGYNGFGKQTFSNALLDNKELLDVSGFTADVFAGIGLRFNIPQSPIAIDLGVNYQFGLMDVIKENSNMAALKNVSNASNALIYNSINGMENVEHIRNLTESLSSVKRQSLLFSAGLILKF